LSEPRSAADGATLLASAIAGRAIPVVMLGSGVTHTDGETIYASPDGGMDSVVVQAALIAAGSLEVGVAKLVGRRGSRSRYLTLEARRAVGRVRDIAPRHVVTRADALFDGPASQSAEESLRRAGSPRVPGAPGWCGEIRPAKLMRHGQAESGAVTESMLAKALQAPDLRELDDEEADDADRSRILDLLAAPINNPMAARLAKMLGMGGSPASGESGAGDDAAMHGNRQGRGRPGATQIRAASGLVRGEPDTLPAGRRHPEWAVERGAYRPDWCTVGQFDPPVTPRTEPLPDEPDVRLRKQLSALGMANEPHRRQGDGDGLDITALVDFASDRRAGRTSDARVYEQRRSTGHDLGVLILLDASGSTGESTDGHQIFAGERRLAARLTAELEALGNRVATYGFYSRGKDNVRFLRAKTFQEPYGYEARRRLAAIEPTGFTRLGAAVRHGTQLLLEQAGTSRLLLVVVGDGLPYEDGYEHRHAYEDTRKALAEAVGLGVGCACIAMRSPTRPEVIDRVWGHVAHCHLEHPHELAHQIRPLIHRALKDAA
jgi:nitric oxide reductase NorD protein